MLIPKNTNGRLAIPALAGLLVLHCAAPPTCTTAGSGPNLDKYHRDVIIAIKIIIFIQNKLNSLVECSQTNIT